MIFRSLISLALGRPHGIVWHACSFVTCRYFDNAWFNGTLPAEREEALRYECAVHKQYPVFLDRYAHGGCNFGDNHCDEEIRVPSRDTALQANGPDQTSAQFSSSMYARASAHRCSAAPRASPITEVKVVLFCQTQTGSLVALSRPSDCVCLLAAPVFGRAT